MTTQINLKFQNDFYALAKDYANSRGYLSIQELVREALRLAQKLDFKNEGTKKFGMIGDDGEKIDTIIFGKILE